MPDLQRQIEDLRRQLNALGEQPDAGALADLERAARGLLADAKNTPQETNAQSLFAEVVKLGGGSGTVPSTTSVRGLLRKARIRLELASDENDVDEVIDILTEALALSPRDGEVIGMLEEAGAKNSQARQRVNDLFVRHGVPRLPPPPSGGVEKRATGAHETNASSTAAAELKSASKGRKAPPTTAQIPLGDDVESLASEITQAYYAGEYQNVIDLSNRILGVQPTNATALDYRQKAEDNLIRGVVPDHRIPFDARVSYNRANSLVRAGNYDEAERLYREARDLAERAGILSWKDAEQALLEIQDLSLAREMISEGDRLLNSDNWAEALRKYEGALRVVANDPAAEDRIEKTRRIQADAENASVQLTMLSGSLNDQVTTLQTVLGTLARLRQLLPNSQRLAQTTADANNRLNLIKTQIADQAGAAMARAKGASSVEERISLTTDALALLEQGNKLDPGDPGISQMLIEARATVSELQRVRQVIERASTLIAQNDDSDLVQARSMLAGLRDYSQDSRYRTVVSDLLARIVERAVNALEDGSVDEAEALVEAAQEDPFAILGRRAEVARVESQIAELRRRSRLRLYGAVGAGFIILLMIIVLTRDVWQPVVFPPPTDTPTATFTPSDTFTPSNTPTDTPLPTETYTPTDTLTPTDTFTPSYTPTDTPTATDTPTPTNTPTITPTPVSLCTVVNLSDENKFVRSRPAIDSSRISELPPGRLADVLEIAQESGTNATWFRIVFDVDGIQVNGWTRSDNVVESTPCPTFE
ncbi:MAG: hypothetical protein IAE89_05465 [Anaerolineae bacterium]|nr:hypothetical protein [Anaerolineae bacterium]